MGYLSELRVLYNLAKAGLLGAKGESHKEVRCQLASARLMPKSLTRTFCTLCVPLRRSAWNPSTVARRTITMPSASGC